MKLWIPGPGPAELGMGMAQETGSLGNLDAYLCWPHCPQKPMDGDRGNLRISKIPEKFVSGLRMGYSCYKVPQRAVGTLLVEDVEVEKMADQGDGGHSGPEGWPRPPQQNLSLSRRSEEAVCPVI